jgi:hypothetical protein
VSVQSYTHKVPAIEAVQQAAITYADAQPEKIKKWRALAARRALLPHVSVGYDCDDDRTTSSSIWGTSTSSRYYIGPDDQTRYKNRQVSIALTWELGDLIWSSDQTSIDVRSRLDAQLRSDLIDEVTKMYYERIRIATELDALEIDEVRKRNDKSLRLAELNALLDGLTGGYFSRDSK